MFLFPYVYYKCLHLFIKESISLRVDHFKTDKFNYDLLDLFWSQKSFTESILSSVLHIGIKFIVV